MLDRMIKNILEYITNLCYSLFRRIGFSGVMNMGKYSAKDIANWFLWKNKVEQLENETEYDDKY